MDGLVGAVYVEGIHGVLDDHVGLHHLLAARDDVDRVVAGLLDGAVVVAPVRLPVVRACILCLRCCLLIPLGPCHLQLDLPLHSLYGIRACHKALADGIDQLEVLLVFKAELFARDPFNELRYVPAACKRRIESDSPHLEQREHQDRLPCPLREVLDLAYAAHHQPAPGADHARNPREGAVVVAPQQGDPRVDSTAHHVAPRDEPDDVYGGLHHVHDGIHEAVRALRHLFVIAGPLQSHRPEVRSVEHGCVTRESHG